MGSADTINTQAAGICWKRGNYNVRCDCGNALPVNNTSAKIAAVVASSIEYAFSDNKIFRAASNVTGSSAVTLTFRDT